MDSCRIQELENKIKEIQDELCILKHDPYKEFNEKPESLDVYCNRIESDDNEVFVIIGRNIDSTYVAQHDIVTIGEKLGNLTFRGIIKGNHNYHKICLEPYQYVLIYNKNHCK